MPGLAIIGCLPLNFCLLRRVSLKMGLALERLNPSHGCDMKTNELEAWALEIIERVKKGLPNEDDKVELKADWKDAEYWARKIAGHANQMHGEPILWLFGVDEKAGTVPGVPLVEMADWIKIFESQFSERVAPELLKHVNVHVDSVTVIALYFETERAPYVLNDKSGKSEVPWRKGTSTYSANRSQLLTILSPTIKLPDVEFMNVSVTAHAKVADGRFTPLRWDFTASAYLIPSVNQPSTVLQHKCNFVIEPWEGKPTDKNGVRLVIPQDGSSREDLLVSQPRKIAFEGIAETLNPVDRRFFVFVNRIRAMITIGVAGTSRVVKRRFELPFETNSETQATWRKDYSEEG